MTHNTKILAILFSTLLVDMIGVGMMIPVFPVLFTDSSSALFLLDGYSTSSQYFIMGAILAVWGFMQFFAAPIMGELSDIYGRKKLLVFGVGTLALGQIIFGLGVEAGLLWVIFASRLIAGAGSGNFSIAQASIADITESKDRAKNFGLIGAAFGVGFILGPLIGGYVAGFTHNPAAPFWVAGALGIINLIVAALFLPETNKSRKGERTFTLLKGFHNIQGVFADVDARPVFFSSFLYVAGFNFFTSFSGVLLVNKYNFSEADMGTFFAVVGIWSVFTQLVILRIVTKYFSERTILAYSILCVGLMLALYPFAPSAFWLYVIIPFIAIPQGLSLANIGALISKGVSPQKQGAALGINGSLAALASGIVPLLAAFGSGYFAIQTPFIVGAFCMLLAWGVLFVRKS